MIFFSERINNENNIEVYFDFLVTFCFDAKAQQVDSLKIFYLPSDFRCDLEITIEDMRNEDWKPLSIYSTEEDSITSTLLQSLAIFNFRPFDSLKSLEPRMVIDIYLKDYKTRKTIILGYQYKFTEYDGIYYFRNIELIRWIDKYIPKATFPIGTKGKKEK